MASGVKVTDEVKTSYSKIAFKSSKQEKLKYGIFKFSDDVKRIEVESEGKKGDDGWEYETLISKLPENDVRYLAYEFDYLDHEDKKGSKMILISWCPDSSPIRKKMLCASSFNALKQAIGAPQNVIEGDSYGEVNSQAVLQKLEAKTSQNESE